MGIRQAINENPVLTSAITGGIIAIALGFIIYQGCNDPGRTNANRAFYSADDGQTWFEDDGKLVPPIMKNGKPAFRATVVKCGDGDPFVSSLERYTPEVKAKMEQMIAANKGERPTTIEFINLEMQNEVRKPATQTWFARHRNPIGYMKAASLPLCPDGSAAIRVYP